MNSTRIGPNIRITHLIIVLITVISLIFSGCQSIFGQTTAASGTAVISLADDMTPDIAVTPNGSPSDAIQIDTPSANKPTPPESTSIVLTLWTPEHFSPQNDLIAQQLTQFTRENPNIKAEFQLRRSNGQASSLSFLGSASRVAPTILPDIVILDTDDLAKAWRNNLIQPLDRIDGSNTISTLLPAARRLVTFENNVAGIPYELNTEHMVYRTSQAAIEPLAWTDVVSQVSSYHFPAHGQNGLLNDALLIQYLSTGAELVDDQGLPIIDEPALRALLEYFQALRDNGIITPDITDANYATALWDHYISGEVTATLINTNQYLSSDQQLVAATEAAPIPGPDGYNITIGRGWAFALVTDDLARQQAAIQLINHFLETDNNAAWSSQSGAIPATQAAFDLLADSNDYWVFMSHHLESMQAPPSFVGYDQLSRILLIAIQQVISGQATPDEAIETAVQALNQSAP